MTFKRLPEKSSLFFLKQFHHYQVAEFTTSNL